MDNTISEIGLVTAVPAENAFDKRSRTPFEAGRTPFDGLRPWSAITHGVGILLALFGTYFLLMQNAAGNSALSTAALMVYGTSMILLYSASTVYHSVNGKAETRIILRKLDHSAVYLLIAGTYTPMCIIGLHNLFSYILLGVIWALAIGGIVTSAFWVNMPRRLTAAIYIALGWLSLSALPFIYMQDGIAPILWLFGGGVLYTVGAVLYAVKWPGRNNPRFGCHEIFHVFIVLGSIVHFMYIFLFLAQTPIV